LSIHAIFLKNPQKVPHSWWLIKKYISVVGSNWHKELGYFGYKFLNSDLTKNKNKYQYTLLRNLFNLRQQVWWEADEAKLTRKQTRSCDTIFPFRPYSFSYQWSSIRNLEMALENFREILSVTATISTIIQFCTGM